MLTLAQRYEFDLRGFVLIRGLIPTDQLARWTAALASLEGRGPDELPANAVPSWTPAINEYRLMGLLETDRAFESLIDPEGLLDWAEALVPGPCRLAEAYSITRLQGLGLPLHAQTEAGYSAGPDGPRTNLLKCSVFLTDVGPDDGPTVIFEGTHKLGGPWPFGTVHPDWEAPGVDPEAERACLADQRGRELRAWEDIPGYREIHARAGDVLVMTDDLWHGATALTSGRRRRTLYTSYVPYHFPNWHGIEYSAALRERVTERQRALLAGPFVGTRYANWRGSELPEALPFPHLPDSSRDPRRFERPDAAPPRPECAPPPALASLARVLTEVADLRGTCVFEVEGEGAFSMRLDEGGAALGGPAGERPDTVVEIGAEDLAALAAGSADPVQLFYEGRARVRGDVQLAMRVVDAWSA